MEKKTIGGFIAALRRANGLTQRELAEKLNVSDKAVSRWERDESAPDLTLIPVIAEIFGVTSDELLRGERSAVEDRPSAKSSRQMEQLLKSTRQKLRSRSWITTGLCVVGLLISFVVHLVCLHHVSFYQAGLISFCTACVFYVAAAVCEGVFVSGAFAAVSGNVFDDAAVNACKRALFATAGKTFGCVAAFLIATVSFLVVDHGFFLRFYFLLYAGIGVLLSVVGFAVAKAVAVRRGVFTLSDTDVVRRRLKIQCTAIVAVVLLLIGLGQGVFYSLTSAATFAEGTVFADWDEFAEYMETRKEAEIPGTSIEMFGVEVYSSVTDDLFTAEPILERECVYNEAGKLVASYLPYNNDVAEIQYGDGEDLLPVTVYTTGDLANGGRILARVHSAFAGVYALVIAAGFVLYFVRRARLQTNKSNSDT